MNTIYIKLLESGVTYVPCKAMHISNMNYKIIDNEHLDLENDATSIWEYFPGDLVKCEIKSDNFLPKGNAEEILVANQLLSLSKSFPNRKTHQLIFLIVSNQGKINLEKLQGFKKEIKELCTSPGLFQRNHPLIKYWLEINCKNLP